MPVQVLSLLALEVWRERTIAACLRSPIVDEEKIRQGHWLGSVLWVSFSASGHSVVKNMCHYPKGLFLNSWKKETGLCGRWQLKQTCWLVRVLIVTPEQIISHNKTVCGIQRVSVNVGRCRMLQLSSLEETVRQLHLDNDNLVRECNKLQQQVRMLEQQAAEANRQVHLLLHL